MARSIFEHEDFAGETYGRREAFIWLVAQAAWKDTATLARGQLSVSRHTMAATFGWTEAKVRWFLRRLQTQKRVQIHSQTNSQGHAPPPTIITICNFDQFQKPAKGNNQGHSQGHSQLEKEEVNKIRKERKNLRLVEPPPDRFDEFWAFYPSRLGDNPKAKAHDKYLALIKGGVDPAVLIAAARSHDGHGKRGDDRKYIPMAVTWLNQRRFEDGPKGPPEKTFEEVDREYQAFCAAIAAQRAARGNQ